MSIQRDSYRGGKLRDQRLGRYSFALGFLFSVITAPITVDALATDEPLYYGEIDPEAKCQSAGENPICVLKTWIACHFTDSPVACGAVGHRPFDLVGRFASSDPQYIVLENRPWQLPLSRILLDDPGAWFTPAFRLVGYREVGPERFVSPVGPIPKELIGTHEVMYAKSDMEAATDYAMSIFLRRQKDSWIVVSTGHWVDWEVLIVPCKAEIGTGARRLCELGVDIQPWPKNFDRLARMIDP